MHILTQRRCTVHCCLETAAASGSRLVACAASLHEPTVCLGSLGQARRLACLGRKVSLCFCSSVSWCSARHGADACPKRGLHCVQVPVLLPDPVPGALQRAGHVPHVCGADARHGRCQLGGLVLPGRLPHALRLHLRAECAAMQPCCNPTCGESVHQLTGMHTCCFKASQLRLHAMAPELALFAERERLNRM